MRRHRSESAAGRRPWDRPLWAACAAWVALAGGADGQMTSIGAHPKQPFPKTIPLPIKIDVGFYLVDFARINAREETFDLQGYLTAHWTDPALARKPGEPKGERRFHPEDLWTPNYEFSNAAEPVRVQNEAALVVDDDGRITQRFRFYGKYSWPMDLRRFPFDTQALKVLIEPFEREIKDVKFSIDPANVGRMPRAFLTDWTILGVDAHVHEAHYPTLGKTNSQIVFTIEIQRWNTFYFFRVLLPLSLLVSTSWVVHRFDPSNLQPLISTTIAILLNVILFNFSIDFALPKVPYLTFLDTFAVTNFVFMLINMHAVTTTHIVFNRQGLAAAQALQRRFLFLTPAGYVVAILIEAAYFLT